MRESSKDSEGTPARLESHKATRLPSFETPASNSISSSGELNSQSEDTAFRTTDSWEDSFADQDPVRASHFADTLARIEGRGPANPPSPIQRYVHPEGLYADGVEVEHCSPVIRCPRPISWANHVRSHVMMRRLLQIGTGAESDKVGFHESAIHHKPRKRTANPTPIGAFFHNDETPPFKKK